jgi:hypothetical protein
LEEVLITYHRKRLSRHVRTSNKAKSSRYSHADDKRERNYSSYSFLTSALEGVSDQRRAPVPFTPGTHWIRSWVGLRAGLDTEAKTRARTLVVQHVVRNYTDCATPDLSYSLSVYQIQLNRRLSFVTEDEIKSNLRNVVTLGS